MNSNDLKKPIEIWKYSQNSNASGTPIEPYVFYKHSYCKLIPVGGDTQNGNPEGDLPVTFVNIVIRYDPNVNYECEIRIRSSFNTQRYKISYIEDMYGDKGFLKLKCTTYNEYM